MKCKSFLDDLRSGLRSFQEVGQDFGDVGRTFTLFPNPTLYLSDEWDEKEGDDDVIKQAKAYVIRDIPDSQKRGQYLTASLLLVALVCAVIIAFADPLCGALCFLGIVSVLFFHILGMFRAWKEWTKKTADKNRNMSD